MTDTSSSDKTPILLHPARRLELLRLGQEHFNNDRFGDAIEMWHQLLNVEQGRDKEFVKMLLDCAGHFADLKKRQGMPQKKWPKQHSKNYRFRQPTGLIAI